MRPTSGVVVLFRGACHFGGSGAAADTAGVGIPRPGAVAMATTPRHHTHPRPPTGHAKITPNTTTYEPLLTYIPQTYKAGGIGT